MSISLAVLNTNTELSRAFVATIASLGVGSDSEINIKNIAESEHSQSPEIVACASLEEVQLCASLDNLPC